jgi:alpha-L-rhamnosidase
VAPGGGAWRDPRRSALRFVGVRNDGDTAMTAALALDAFEIDLVPAGELRTSDPVVDAVYAAARRTVLRCTHDYVEDGPKRDRLLWLGDLAATADVFAKAVGDCRPLRRSLLLAAATQLRTGALPGVGPHPNDLVVADYVPQFARALHAYVVATGDLETAELLLPTLGRALHFLAERQGAEGLVGPEEETDWWVFLDWDRREPFGSPVAKRGHVIALSLLTAAALRAGAAIASWLGSERRRAEWAERGDLLVERVRERAWDDDQRLLVDWVRGGERARHASRFTNAWGVIAAVGTPAERGLMADALAGARLEPTTTGYGQTYNVDALFRAGRAEAALAIVRRYWGTMLARGATTFWESFDPDEDPATELNLYGRRYAVSRCHGWSGAIAGTLATHLLGVDVVAPGFRRVALAPRLGDLAWVEGAVPTPLGPIRLRWAADGARVELPAGVAATVAWRGRTVELGAGVHALA